MSRIGDRAIRRRVIAQARSGPQNGAYRRMRSTFKGIMPRPDARRIAGILRP